MTGLEWNACCSGQYRLRVRARLPRAREAVVMEMHVIRAVDRLHDSNVMRGQGSNNCHPEERSLRITEQRNDRTS